MRVTQLFLAGDLSASRSRRSTILRFVAISIFICGAQIQSLAQSSVARLSGIVHDESGAVLIGARVTVTNASTNIKRTAATNSAGFFLLPFLPPSIYNVRTNLPGFSASEVTNVELHANDHVELNILLKVGDINETVMVEGSGSLIKAESASLGTIVTRNLVENIPLNGRSFQSLVALAPGVTMTRSDATNQGQFSVNGQRADSNYFTVDGVGANFGAGHSYTIGGTTPANNAVGSSAGLVSIDALEELNVQTSSYAPEFGRGSGGQIGAVTRSGSNRLQGSLFEYFRHDALDANDWFANSRGLRKGTVRHNDFGGVIGGPVIRKRTFFFFSYEGLRLRQPVTINTTVPSAAFRQSAPALMQPYLNAFPVPNGEVLSSTRARFSIVVSNPRTMDAASLRIDHALNDRIKIFGRYNHAPSHIGTRSSPGSSYTDRRYLTNTITLGSTSVLGRQVVNDLRANFSKSSSDSVTRLTDFAGATPLPDSLVYPNTFSVPGRSFFSFAVDGSTISVNQSGLRQQQLNIVDNLSATAGKHEFRFGIDYRALRPSNKTADYGVAITTTSALVPSSRASRVTISSRLDGVYPQYQNFSAYGQDSWRASSRLTVIYGVRWDVNPAPREKKGNYPYDGISSDKKDRDDVFWKTRFSNLAPRMGLSYLVRTNRRSETVLRGGFGVFYDLANGTAGASMNPFAFPYTGSRVITNVVLPLTDTETVPPALGQAGTLVDAWAFNHDLHNPRTYQWSLGVQQALGTTQSFSASYVGNVGRRLIADQFAVDPMTGNPRFHYVDDTGTSDYRSIQLQFERRASRGLNATISYTLGKSIDTSSTDSAYLVSVDPEQLQLDRAPSDFDVRHTLSSGITYEVPAWRQFRFMELMTRGWTLSSMLILRSAMPITYIEADNTFCDANFCSVVCNYLNNTGTCPRPDIVPVVPFYLFGPEYPGGMRLNPAAFKTPPAGRQGTLPRNYLRGFPAEQVNISLRREFDIAERVKLSFTAEAFNIFNHPNFADPSAIFSNDPLSDSERFGFSRSMLGSAMGNTGSSGEAGLNPIYQIGSPRSFQFSLRLKF
jgi:hypothetical protein